MSIQHNITCVNRERLRMFAERQYISMKKIWRLIKTEFFLEVWKTIYLSNFLTHHGTLVTQGPVHSDKVLQHTWQDIHCKLALTFRQQKESKGLKAQTLQQLPFLVTERVRSVLLRKCYLEHERKSGWLGPLTLVAGATQALCWCLWWGVASQVVFIPSGFVESSCFTKTTTKTPVCSVVTCPGKQTPCRTSVPEGCLSISLHD